MRLEDRYGLFVGGEFVEPRSGEFFATVDPSTEEPLAEVAEAGPEDVDVAVRAARVGKRSIRLRLELDGGRRATLGAPC